MIEGCCLLHSLLDAKRTNFQFLSRRAFGFETLLLACNIRWRFAIAPCCARMTPSAHLQTLAPRVQQLRIGWHACQLRKVRLKSDPVAETHTETLHFLFQTRQREEARQKRALQIVMRADLFARLLTLCPLSASLRARLQCIPLSLQLPQRRPLLPLNRSSPAHLAAMLQI